MCFSVSSLSSCLKTSFGGFDGFRYPAIVDDDRTNEALPIFRFAETGEGKTGARKYLTFWQTMNIVRLWSL